MHLKQQAGFLKTTGLVVIRLSSAELLETTPNIRFPMFLGADTVRGRYSPHVPTIAIDLDFRANREIRRIRKNRR